MKMFLLHWRGGSKELVKGATAEEAFQAAGIGQGAIKALDYYEPYLPTGTTYQQRIMFGTDWYAYRNGKVIATGPREEELLRQLQSMGIYDAERG